MLNLHNLHKRICVKLCANACDGRSCGGIRRGIFFCGSSCMKSGNSGRARAGGRETTRSRTVMRGGRLAEVRLQGGLWEPGRTGSRPRRNIRAIRCHASTHIRGFALTAGRCSGYKKRCAQKKPAKHAYWAITLISVEPRAGSALGGDCL